LCFGEIVGLGVGFVSAVFEDFGFSSHVELLGGVLWIGTDHVETGGGNIVQGSFGFLFANLRD
jgi:hypothetical protein